ncbi:unnamed protein product [Tilletia controversa]|nr:unnamed protein product [Tilletia controversa]
MQRGCLSAATAAGVLRTRSVWHRPYSSYIPPPSNNELDPSGVDSSLFEEDSIDDYTNTRHSLQLLTRIRPSPSASASASASADKEQPVPFPSASSSRTTIHRPLLSPADMLADLIVKNELHKANQLLSELNNLQTDLGMPTIEYIRAALRSLHADDPALCSSANVLTWLRLAPSVQQLQAQAQLRAFPDLYAGIPHQHLTKLELGPRRHVQDRTRAAANIMFQNCLALFTQRGSSSRAVADLREALLLSVERGYVGARDNLAISFLASHLSTRSSTPSPSTTSSGEDTDNPLRSLWTDLVIASRRGAETRPSGGDQYPEDIHPELHGLLCARLRKFFNIIVRTAALRGGPALLDAINLVESHEAHFAKNNNNNKGKMRYRDEWSDGLALVSLMGDTKECVLAQIQKALKIGVPNPEERNTFLRARNNFRQWGEHVERGAASYLAAHKSDVAGKAPYALPPHQSEEAAVTLEKCTILRREILDYIEGARIGLGDDERPSLELKRKVTLRVTRDVHHLYEMLLRLYDRPSMSNSPSPPLPQRSEANPIPASEPGPTGEADADAEATTTETRDALHTKLSSFLLPIELALPQFGGRAFPPIVATASMRSLTRARRYEDAVRVWAQTYGNDCRAGVGSAFLAMALLDPLELLSEQRRLAPGAGAGAMGGGGGGKKDPRSSSSSKKRPMLKTSTRTRSDRKRPAGEPRMREAVERQAVMPPGTHMPYRVLNRAGAVHGLDIAIAACEWDSDRLSRLYKMWLAQITELVDVDVDISGRGGDEAEGKNRKGGEMGMRRRVIRGEVNMSDEELLVLFELFIRGFIRQRSAEVVKQGPQTTVATRGRAQARDRKIRSLLRDAARNRKKTGTTTTTMTTTRRVPTQGIDFRPSWILHAEASFLTRLLRIFKDVRMLGLPPFRVEVWNSLLRALSSRGKAEWEGVTLVLMRGMGMVGLPPVSRPTANNDANDQPPFLNRHGPTAPSSPESARHPVRTSPPSTPCFSGSKRPYTALRPLRVIIRARWGGLVKGG